MTRTVLRSIGLHDRAFDDEVRLVFFAQALADFARLILDDWPEAINTAHPIDQRRGSTDGFASLFGCPNWRPGIRLSHVMRQNHRCADLRCQLNHMGAKVLAYGGIGMASRLCSNAGRGQVIVSEPFYNALKNPPEVEALEPIDLKGKSETVPVYRLKL